MLERPNWRIEELSAPIEPATEEEARVLVNEARDLVGKPYFFGDDLDRFSEIMIMLLGGENNIQGAEQISNPFTELDDANITFGRYADKEWRIDPEITITVSRGEQKEEVRYVERERDKDFDNSGGPTLQCSPMLELQFDSAFLGRVIEVEPERRAAQGQFSLKFTAVQRFCKRVLDAFEHSSLSPTSIPDVFLKPD